MSERIHSIEQVSEEDNAGIIIGEAALIRDDDRVPPGYSLHYRIVRLVSGRIEPIYYSTHESQVPNPQAWEVTSASIIEGFMWALQVREFADRETEDDDRAQEIGNMMSYAISQGLTEEQAVECYRQAYAIASA